MTKTERDLQVEIEIIERQHNRMALATQLGFIAALAGVAYCLGASLGGVVSAAATVVVLTWACS